jgi:predicted nucleotidyltransferase component of viral defense system
LPKILGSFQRFSTDLDWTVEQMRGADYRRENWGNFQGMIDGTSEVLTSSRG